jgi:uncharacterized protein YcbK (DUF882 family)
MVLSTGLLTALVLSGCVTSSLENSFDPKLTADTSQRPAQTASAQSQTQVETINPATAQEVEIRDGEPVTADQQAVITAATNPQAGAIPVPQNATAFRSTNSDQQMQVALNAARGSIFSTAPPKPEEAAAAQKSGVTVPTSVPAPSFNPAVINIYTPQEPQAASAEAVPATAPQAKQELAAPKGGRVLGPADTAQQVNVAGLFTMQPQNPAAVPVPAEPPVADFNAGRFSQPPADKTAKIEPANPLRLETPQPGNPMSATPDDGSRPVAKLNAFFPPKPAAVVGEGDDGESADDETDSGDDEPAGLMRLISAPGLARVAPNGIWIQTPYVETDCFKPELMKMLHTVEKHYGKPPIVTSGYRPPVWNSKAGGAEHSLHTTCSAADIQVNGVSKWDLATYLRSLPDRGGVGTYCYTNSVHIDTGDQRDWDWRCRRKTKKHK